jgi:hypothetical protein
MRALVVSTGGSSYNETIKKLQESLRELRIQVETIKCCAFTDVIQKCQQKNGETYAAIFVGAESVLKNEKGWVSDLKRCQSSTKHSLPLVAFVDRDQPTQTRSCIDLGMFDVVSDPFHADALYESICSLPRCEAPLEFGYVERILSKSGYFSCSSAGGWTDFHDDLPMVLENSSSKPLSDSLQAVNMLATHRKEASTHLCPTVAPRLRSSGSVKVTDADFCDHTHPLPRLKEEILPDTWTLAVNR